MITEETIEQTNFYKGEDGEHYLVTDVRIVKLVTLINCVDRTESKLLLGDDVCRTFVPMVPAFEPFEQNQVAAEKPAAKTVRRTAKPVRKATGKLGKRKKSKYKGVSPAKPTLAGVVRYNAICWDGKKKRAISLGTYDRELEAAAVYQDHIGNKAKAAEYRRLDRQQQGKQNSTNTTPDAIRQRKADMAEQVENNPDRESKPPLPKLKIWICTHCKMSFKHPTKPLRCPNCDSTSFREG